jgi:hypothetical protein
MAIVLSIHALHFGMVLNSQNIDIKINNTSPLKAIDKNWAFYKGILS